MRFRVYTYISLIVLGTVGSTLLIINSEYYLAGLTILAVIFFVFRVVKEFKVHTEKLTYMLDAIENDDYSFRFFDRDQAWYNSLYNKTLNRIKNILNKRSNEVRERERYFELMLNNVITGVVTINKRGDVLNVNDKALELLRISLLTHIEQLKRIDIALYEAFKSEDTGEIRRVKIYDESGEIHLSLRYSYIIINEERLKIIAINDIGDELEEKEMDSWTKLIRVLTHEIMNSVTPIASLSETLSEMSEQLSESPDKNLVYLNEISQGLKVINSTSKSLISFVDSYRSLIRIPKPDRKIVPVRDFLDRIIILMRDEIAGSGADVKLLSGDESVMVWIDEGQISQVVINLIRNAIAATSRKKDPHIEISYYISQTSEDVVVEVSNNGDVISKEMQEQIFVPFFTTKQSGTGIGLSISRQIMRLHNGTLKLKNSDENETIFMLTFR